MPVHMLPEDLKINLSGIKKSHEQSSQYGIRPSTWSNIL